MDHASFFFEVTLIEIGHTSFKRYLQKSCIVQQVTLLTLVFVLNSLDKILFPLEAMNKRIL